MSLARLDAFYLHNEIERLKLAQPDLWESNDEQFKLDMLEGETSLNEFLTKVVRGMILDEAVVLGAKAEIVTVKARRDRYERRIAALRALAFKIMQHADVRSIELASRTLSIRRGTPRVIITDETALPDVCWRVTREPNLTAIKDHLKDGPVPGASLSNAEPVLDIRK